MPFRLPLSFLSSLIQARGSGRIPAPLAVQGVRKESVDLLNPARILDTGLPGSITSASLSDGSSRALPNFPGPNFPRPNFPRPNFPRPNFPRPNLTRPNLTRPGIVRAGDRQLLPDPARLADALSVLCDVPVPAALSRRSFLLRAGHAAGLASVTAAGVVVPSNPAAAYNPPKSEIVVNARTGDILHSSSIDSERYPASLTKMMTLYLLFSAIDAGHLRSDTPLPASARAEGQSPSKLGLRKGQTITVRDAVHALIVKSANDVATVVAEAIAGSEIAFAQMMTRQAQALGMTRTSFRNASGLPNPNQVTTARDLLILSMSIMRDFPHHYPVFSTLSFTWSGRVFTTHNRILKTTEGADGLKTGFIRASGFNLAASAARSDQRLVAVVLGGNTAKLRDQRTAQLLGKGFASLGL